MNPEAEFLAQIYAAANPGSRPWSAKEFTAFLGDENVVCIPTADGFLLGRAVLDEAEILTICVHPAQQRNGIGSTLLGKFLDVAKMSGARLCHLEVSADNAAAIALYHQYGFGESGRRKLYYRRKNGERRDAILLSKLLI